MGLWTATRRWIVNQLELDVELERIFGPIGGTTASGMNVTTESALRVSTVYACVRLISESIAQLPLSILRQDGENLSPATDHPVYSLLKDRPNEWQSAFEYVEMKVWDILLSGNAYSFKVPGTRGIQELIRLNPARVKPEQDKDTLKVTYRIRMADGSARVFDQSEIMHWRGPGDGLVGMNPIEKHRETIGLAMATREHGARVFKNGARPAGLLIQEVGKELSPTARENLKKDFAELYEGVPNAGKTAILPVGISFETVNISNKDAQYLDTRKFQRSEIASIFRVPPHMIGDLEKATFDNIEMQSIEFVVFTLGAWLRRIEQAIKRDLLDDDDLFPKFNVNALLRGDSKSRAEALQIQRRNGVINANEWRKIEDMNPRTDPGGDEYIVEQNMGRQDGNDEQN